MCLLAISAIIHNIKYFYMLLSIFLCVQVYMCVNWLLMFLAYLLIGSTCIFSLTSLNSLLTIDIAFFTCHVFGNCVPQFIIFLIIIIIAFDL